MGLARTGGWGIGSGVGFARSIRGGRKPGAPRLISRIAHAAPGSQAAGWLGLGCRPRVCFVTGLALLACGAGDALAWAGLAAAAAFPAPSAAAALPVQSTPAADDPWEIVVTSPSREVIFTNKRATHFAADTGARDMRSYAGLYTSMHECLTDYVLQVDGVELDPARAQRVRVWPWLLRREYEGGLAEEVLLPLDEPALLVRVALDGPGAAPEAKPPASLQVTPRLDMRWIWEVPQPEYERIAVNDVVCFRRKGWKPGPGGLEWLAVQVSARATFVEQPQRLHLRHPRDAARRAMEATHPWQPGRLEAGWPKGAHSMDVVFAQGSTAEEAAARARRLLPQRDALLAARRGHVDALLARASVTTGDARLDKAYRWARASMDAMLMQTRGPGIYAGFHWFPNYWGRDTFISIPGATLVTGELDAARAILRSFLLFQNVDRSSPRLGRLPNIVQPNELQYAGVDGTWWYVRAAYRYVQACRAAGRPDAAYELELAAALRVMIDGAERWAVDRQGFLTHGDGETWMDAGGEQHPYSPRGNRAVEVQALYYNGLRVAEWLAGEQAGAAGGGAQQRAAWEQLRAQYGALAARTRAAFRASFWDARSRRLADHLNVDDSRDGQLRPNVILALTAVEPAWQQLLAVDEARAVVDLVMEQLVLPWGVTSLDPSDPQFRPRHLDLNRYFFDEAYHNGDIWYWLSGPMITALCRTGRAQEAVRLLEPLVAQALDHGAVGAIQEIRDGAQGDQQEEFGGAVFQAWSMAEMIRAMHEDLAKEMGWSVQTAGVGLRQ